MNLMKDAQISVNDVILGGYLNISYDSQPVWKWNIILYFNNLKFHLIYELLGIVPQVHSFSQMKGRSVIRYPFKYSFKK